MESRSNNLEERKQKVLDFINVNGPSLPVRIASNLKMDSLIVSALLAELTKEKQLFMSNMRVGSSPLYYVRGQEFQLEKYVQYLNKREREAFDLLKNYGVLADEKVEPAIRVALRSIKDFSFPLEHNNKLYWRFIEFSLDRAVEKINSGNENYSIIGKTNQEYQETEQETENQEGVEEKKEETGIEKKRIQEEKGERRDGGKREEDNKKDEKESVPFFQKIKQVVLPKEQELVERGLETKPKDNLFREEGYVVKRETDFIQTKNEDKEEKPLLKIKKNYQNKEKEKSDFVFDVVNFLESKEFIISKEIDWKKKEYFAEVKGDTNFGKVVYHVMAKDKKSITDNDLLQAIQTCQDKKMPVILVSKGEPNRKAQEKLDEARNLVFFMKLS